MHGIHCQFVSISLRIHTSLSVQIIVMLIIPMAITLGTYIQCVCVYIYTLYYTLYHLNAVSAYQVVTLHAHTCIIYLFIIIT